MIVFVLEDYDARAVVNGSFNPGKWKKAFLASRTGKRVVRIAGGRTFRVVNSTCKKIIDHITRHDPDLVILCGQKAKEAVNKDILSVPVMQIPHPAWRLMRNVDIDSYSRTIDMYLNR